VSWGGQEGDYPPNYQIRQCNEFMKLSLQGVTILVASGDDGPAGSGPEYSSPCIGSDEAFNPNSPACPYVTLVEGTALPVGSSPSDPEISYFSTFISGGGFSNLYAIPSYQENAVNSSVHTYT
jgi:tripeptidyl-peptidase-1